MLGWTDFNLLPFITVALFVVQQKMFMPPPTDEQQEMQYKMMNVMTIVMGVMFYQVPVRPVRVLHLVEPVGHRRTEAAHLVEADNNSASGHGP